MEEDKGKLLRSLLVPIIQRQVAPVTFNWLEEKGKLINAEAGTAVLHASFSAVPRKTGRAITAISQSEFDQILEQHNGFMIKGWGIDRLCRLYLVVSINSDESIYSEKVEGLFRDAEMNELAALYSFLPVLHHPASWVLRTAEGIRSNIGTVLEAIMYHNSYPYQYLPEPSWNQLVLKAFFTDKDVNRILGLDDRANKALASVLVDYAHERQAAQRSVNPQLWRLVCKFLDENNISDIENLFEDGHITEKRAAVLACYHSNYEPARRLVEKEPAILADVKSNKLNWSLL